MYPCEVDPGAAKNVAHLTDVMSEMEVDPFCGQASVHGGKHFSAAEIDDRHRLTVEDQCLRTLVHAGLPRRHALTRAPG